jgi:glycosyltransferase involved in cell wall biosynthesis
MKTLSILHIVLGVSETSMPYNEFALKQAEHHKVSLATFFTSKEVSPSIVLYEGDNTFLGFYRLIKKIFTNKDFDIVHVHSPHVALMLLIMRPFLSFDIEAALYTVHNSFPSYKPRNKLLMLLPFRCYPRVVFCSHASYESFPWIYKRLVGNRSRVVQNGMNIGRVDQLLKGIEKRELANTFKIAVVGRLIDIKNPFVALRAFNQASKGKSKLIFIGEGPLRDNLVQKVDELGLTGKVAFTGLISREKVYRLLSNADLFLSTSNGEGLPVAVLEAMACRCPVILSDIAPHREIGKNVDFIQLIRPDNVDGFAQEIRRFQKLSYSEIIKVGEKCRQLVEEYFDLSAMLEKYEDIYLELSNQS